MLHESKSFRVRNLCGSSYLRLLFCTAWWSSSIDVIDGNMCSSCDHRLMHHFGYFMLDLKLKQANGRNIYPLSHVTSSTFDLWHKINNYERKLFISAWLHVFLAEFQHTNTSISYYCHTCFKYVKTEKQITTQVLVESMNIIQNYTGETPYPQLHAWCQGMKS